jgi:hypothetical protein
VAKGRGNGVKFAAERTGATRTKARGYIQQDVPALKRSLELEFRSAAGRLVALVCKPCAIVPSRDPRPRIEVQGFRGLPADARLEHRRHGA